MTTEVRDFDVTDRFNRLYSGSCSALFNTCLICGPQLDACRMFQGSVQMAAPVPPKM